MQWIVMELLNHASGDVKEARAGADHGLSPHVSIYSL